MYAINIINECCKKITKLHEKVDQLKDIIDEYGAFLEENHRAINITLEEIDNLDIKIENIEDSTSDDDIDYNNLIDEQHDLVCHLSALEQEEGEIEKEIDENWKRLNDMYSKLIKMYTWLEETAKQQKLHLEKEKYDLEQYLTEIEGV